MKTQKTNIVLIGMPGSGKSTVGKALAAELGREFFDSDAEIEKAAGMPVSEIFRSRGETEFRRLETEAVAALSKKKDAVIATGGGAVMKTKNAEALKSSGFVVWLDCPVDVLSLRAGTDASRPLLKGNAEERRERLAALLSLRAPVYGETADIKINAARSVSDLVQEIKTALGE